MLPVLAVAAAAFAGCVGAAAVCAGVGAWLPALIVLAPAAAAWAAAVAAATALVVRGARGNTAAAGAAGAALPLAAQLAATAAFGALYAALWARDAGAFAAAARDGWSPYFLAIDAASAGLGVVLPVALVPQLAVSAQQMLAQLLLSWPAVAGLLAVVLLSGRRARQ